MIARYPLLRLLILFNNSIYYLIANLVSFKSSTSTQSNPSAASITVAFFVYELEMSFSSSFPFFHFQTLFVTLSFCFMPNA